MSRFVKWLAGIIGVVLLTLVVLFATPIHTYIFNKIDYVDKKIDDATSYKTLKKVEDTCRAMMASYNTDKLTYEQYKNTENEWKTELAEQAKMRANKTASTYNNYILANTFVWVGNVPSDISSELPYLD